ncbi:L-serine dehydratase [Elusimicrobium simillimum]|uniref:L-serine ammonia-lyase n=1 Tax=Elusimicrobium simillimum TaxID=3143438 RepID=UPI003C6F185E
MKSIRELYKVGMGPSSSHTMGPRKAAEDFAKENEDASSFRVHLYGSLALTGRGHLTDVAVKDGLAPKPVEIVWENGVFLPFHPNALKFESLDQSGAVLLSKTVYSIGGGEISEGSERKRDDRSLYPLTTMDEILDYTLKKKITLWEYVEECEGPEIWEFLYGIWKEMQKTIEAGLSRRGTLPGELNLERKAQKFYKKALSAPGFLRRKNMLFAFALACAEENASGGVVVTAPTCGSCGVVPAVLRFAKDVYDYTDTAMVRALATAGLIGNLAKNNASISGAEVGCQGEIGVACAMAAAAMCQLESGDNKRVAYAAEMGLEHHLGLTCDPVAGLVQIPCIERNAMAAARALDCSTYSMISEGENHVSYDEVLQTMMQTGKDMNSAYRETAEGGLAKFFKIKKLFKKDK